MIEDLSKLPFLSRLYLRGVPLLAIVHHLFGTTAFRQVSAPVASCVVATEALLPVVYRGWPMVAVSPSTRDDLVARGIPRRDDPRDSERARPRALPPRRRAGGARPVVFVGRVEPYKRVDVLLDAWLHVRAARPGGAPRDRRPRHARATRCAAARATPASAAA